MNLRTKNIIVSVAGLLFLLTGAQAAPHHHIDPDADVADCISPKIQGHARDVIAAQLRLMPASQRHGDVIYVAPDGKVYANKPGLAENAKCKPVSPGSNRYVAPDGTEFTLPMLGSWQSQVGQYRRERNYPPLQTFNFGTLRTGKHFVHVFTITNTTNKPVPLGDVVPKALGMSGTLLGKFHGKPSLLAPGGKFRVLVDFDSAKYNKINYAHYRGAIAEPELDVNAKNEPVLPFAMLILRGKLTHAVSFDRDTVDLDVIHDAEYADETLHVFYDKNVFHAPGSQPQCTDPRVLLTPVGHAHYLAHEIEQTYRISAAPHAPLGTVEALISVHLSGGTQEARRENESISSLDCEGNIIGNVNAAPIAAEFGFITRPTVPAAVRTVKPIWIVLTDTHIKQSDATAFWLGTHVLSSEDGISARIVLPGASAASGPGARSPGLPPYGLASGGCWLEVGLDNYTRKRQVSGTITLVFPDKDRMTIPVGGQVE